MSAEEIEHEMEQWLRGGLAREDLRLALFDMFGERIDPEIVRAAIAARLAEPWFSSPMHPQWMVCRLTRQGYDALVSHGAANKFQQ